MAPMLKTGINLVIAQYYNTSQKRSDAVCLPEAPTLSFQGTCHAVSISSLAHIPGRICSTHSLYPSGDRYQRTADATDIDQRVHAPAQQRIGVGRAVQSQSCRY